MKRYVTGRRIPVDVNKFEFEVPFDSYVLSIEIINGIPYMFFDVYEREPSENRIIKFEAFLSGQEIPQGYYPVGSYTIKINGVDEWIWHVFGESN